MEGAFKSADGAGDGRIHVAEGGDGDAGAESAGVHAVVGVQDVGNVEGVSGIGGGLLTAHEVEEAAGLAEVGADGGHGQALAVTMVGGDDEGHLSAESKGAFAVQSGILVIAAKVETAEQRDGGAQYGHRLQIFRQAGYESGDFGRKAAEAA